MKSKEMKVGSSEWQLAWKRMLANEIVVRSVLDQSHHSLEFLIEILVLHEGIPSIMRIERSSASSYVSAKRPKEFCEHYAAPIEALLEDMRQVGIRPAVFSEIPMQDSLIALPARGFIRPLGMTKFLIVPPYHQAFMAFYGTVRAWFHGEGRKYFTNPDLGIVLMHRFDAFLYRQEVSLLQESVGRVALGSES